MAISNYAYLNDQEESLSNTSNLINPAVESEDPMITGIGKNFGIQQDQAFGENAGLFGSNTLNDLNSAPGPGDDDNDDDDDDDLIPVKDDDDDVEILEDDDDPFTLDEDEDEDDLDDSF